MQSTSAADARSHPCTIGGLPTTPGRLSFSPHGVDVEGADGRTLHLPYDALVLELGGDEGEYIYLRTAGFTVWTRTADALDELAAVSGSRLAVAIQRLRGHRKSRRRGVWLGVALLFGAALALVLVALALPSIAASSVGLLPTSLDVALGDAAGGDLALGAPLSSAAIDACVREPALRLATLADGHEDFTFRIEVLESEEVNAFALPGGRMVVLAGLLRSAGDQDEVLGVVAHEIAHVTHRDGLRGVARRAGIWAALDLLLGGASGAFLGLGADAAVMVTASAYGRDAESAADEEGARIMARAGLDPLGMARFFERLEGVPGTELPHALAWLSDHPEHAERVAAIRALAPSLSRAERTTLAPCDWAALRAEVGAR